MFLKITSNYLWIPIQEDVLIHDLEIRTQKDALGIRLKIAETAVDYYAYLQTQQWIGDTIELLGNVTEDTIRFWKQEQTPPEVRADGRPQLHFAADVGWINDPNGLVYHHGEYHLYYQFNPYDTVWNNMSWGHAKSRDLIHWTQENVVMHPDENGTIYSGCALPDVHDVMGYGTATLLFFYTAAGSMSTISEGKNFTQRWAYSVDDGQTLTKVGAMDVTGMAKETRDPKIFWHDETNAYIMVLYIDKNDFAIYRSEDLIHWVQSQKLTFEEAWECPDLFKLNVDDGEPKWVFWSADGFYFIGDFDGYIFTTEVGRQNAYVGTLPYAAQTFAGLERVISVAWLRTKNAGKNYTGMMSIPQQLSLANTKEGLKLRLQPVDGLLSLRKNHVGFAPFAAGKHKIVTTENIPYELIITLNETKQGTTTLNLFGKELCIDMIQKEAMYAEQEFHFIEGQKMDIRIIVDFGAIEIFANNGMIYLARENERTDLAEEIWLHVTADESVTSVDYFELGKGKI